MSKVLLYLLILLLAILGGGLVARFGTNLPSRWQKQSSMLLTNVWMVIITVGLSIVMVVLFLSPIQRKSQHHQAATNKLR